MKKNLTIKKTKDASKIKRGLFRNIYEKINT